jgi:hypothetical protein
LPNGVGLPLETTGGSDLLARTRSSDSTILDDKGRRIFEVESQPPDGVKIKRMRLVIQGNSFDVDGDILSIANAAGTASSTFEDTVLVEFGKIVIDDKSIKICSSRENVN